MWPPVAPRCCRMCLAIVGSCPGRDQVPPFLVSRIRNMRRHFRRKSVPCADAELFAAGFALVLMANFALPGRT